MNERLLRIEEVAERVGLQRGMLYKLIKRGEFLPPIKIGRSARWQAAAVDRWIQEKAAAMHGG